MSANRGQEGRLSNTLVMPLCSTHPHKRLSRTSNINALSMHGGLRFLVRAAQAKKRPSVMKLTTFAAHERLCVSLLQASWHAVNKALLLS